MKIVYLGDSVTEGWFGFCRDENGNLGGRLDRDACYVHQTQLRLQATFPDKEIDCINAGIGGENAAQALSRLQRERRNKPLLSRSHARRKRLVPPFAGDPLRKQIRFAEGGVTCRLLFSPDTF